jgi:RHS repeat-associated protein
MLLFGLISKALKRTGLRGLSLGLAVWSLSAAMAGVPGSGGGNLEHKSSRSIQVGPASVDAIAGSLSMSIPVGPTLPGRIPLGIHWSYDSSSDKGTFALYKWPSWTDAHQNRVTITLNQRKVTFVPMALWNSGVPNTPSQGVTSAQAIKWLQDRGAWFPPQSGTFGPNRTITYQPSIDRVMVSEDGSQYFVIAQNQWTINGIGTTRVCSQPDPDGNRECWFEDQAYTIVGSDAPRFAVVSGDTVTWISRMSTDIPAGQVTAVNETTEIRSRWGDWVQVYQQIQYSLLQVKLTSSLGHTITATVDGTNAHLSVTNSMGLANYAADFWPQYYTTGVDGVVVDATQRLLKLTNDVQGTLVTLGWQSMGAPVTSNATIGQIALQLGRIDTQSGATYQYNWTQYDKRNPSSQKNMGVSPFSEALQMELFTPDYGNWKGYEPVSYSGTTSTAYAIAELKPSITSIQVSSSDASAAPMSYTFIRTLPQPTGYDSTAKTINWGSTNYQVELRMYPVADPATGGPYRFNRFTLASPNPSYQYGDPSASLAAQRQMALFASNTVVKEESGDSDGTTETLRNRLVMDGWSFRSFTNPQGVVSGLVGITPIATRMISERPQGDGPTVITEMLGWDGRTYTNTRKVTLSQGSVAPNYDSTGRPSTLRIRGVDLPDTDQVSGAVERSTAITGTWSVDLVQMKTSTHQSTLSGSDYLAARGTASQDLGTKTYAYDTLGRATQITGKTGDYTSTLQQDHGMSGRPEITSTTRSLVGPNGSVALSGRVGEDYQYTGLWRTGVRQRPDNRWTSEERDALGRLTAQTTPEGIRTTFLYDSLGRMYQSTRQAVGAFGAVTTRTEWDPAGRWVREYAPAEGGGELLKETLLDAYGRPVSVTSAKGSSAQRTVYVQYDSWGQKVKESLPTKSGATAKYTEQIFDRDGFLLSTKNTRGTVTATFQRGQWGTLIGVSGWLSQVTGLRGTTKMLKNTFGQIIRQQDPLGQISAMTYDSFGRMTQVTRGSQSRSYTYNDMGWLLSQTQPEEGTTTFSNFTMTGTPLTVVKGAVTTTTTLNGVGDVSGNTSLEGLLKTVSVSAAAGSGLGGTVSRTLTYDANRRLSSVLESQPNGSMSENYTYDELGRAITKTLSEGSVAFSISQTFDTFGKVRSFNYPTGGGAAARALTPAYDSLHRNTGISYGASSIATMAYDQTINGQEGEKLAYANGATTTWQRNADQELSRVIHSAKPASGVAVMAIEDVGVTWSDDGLMTDRGADHFDYDALSRLSHARVSGPLGQVIDQNFGFDQYGNRTSVISSAVSGILPEEAATFALTVGTDNRLPATTVAGALTGKQYDALGRLQQVWAIPGRSDTLTSWTYDASGRVVSQGGASSAYAESYVLDSAGLRFKRVKANGTVQYTMYGFGREPLSIFEKPSGGSLTWKQDMVYGFGQLLLEKRGTQSLYQQGDHLGSPSILSDANGVVAGRQKSLPYGERVGGSGEKSLRRFTNHEDGAQFPIYMQARMYLPTYGRFAQVDPQYDHSSDGLNLYSYVSNSPVTKSDPDGMRELGGAGGGGGHSELDSARALFQDWVTESNGQYTDTMLLFQEMYNASRGRPGGGTEKEEDTGPSPSTPPDDGAATGNTENPGEQTGGGDTKTGDGAPSGGDGGAQSVGQLLESKGQDAADRGDSMAQIGWCFLKASYEVLTPGGDRLSQVNARAQNGEIVPAKDLAVAGGIAIAQVALTAAPQLGVRGGANSTFWSGSRAAKEAAAAAGTSLERTTIGRALDYIHNADSGLFKHIKVPKPVWDFASSMFASNATGTAKAFLTETVRPTSTWMTIEKKILEMRSITIFEIKVP